MIKRSAILLLILALVSFSLVLFTSYETAAATEPAEESPVKCSDVPCNKKNPATLPWNIIPPAMFQNRG